MTAMRSPGFFAATSRALVEENLFDALAAHEVEKGDDAETANISKARAAQTFLKEKMQQADEKLYFAVNHLGNTFLHELVLAKKLYALVALLNVLPNKLSVDQIKKLFGMPNTAGDTAFHLLARSEQWQMMNMLAGECLKYKITPDFLNAASRTPLEEMLAFAKYSEQIDLENVVILIRCGAKITNAVSIARQKKFSDAVSVLQDGAISAEMRQRISSPNPSSMPLLDKMMTLMEGDTPDDCLYHSLAASFDSDTKQSALRTYSALHQKHLPKKVRPEDVYIYFRCSVM